MMHLNVLTTPDAPTSPDAVPELPAGLADPLHLPEVMAPWVFGCGCLLLLLLAVLLVLWWLSRLGKRATKPAAAKQPPNPRPRARSAGDRIDALAERFEADPRQGCHHLAALLRDHFETERHEPLDHLTAREISGRLGDGKMTKLLTRLADLQFGRDDPSPRSFRSLCRDARWLVEGQRGRRPPEDEAEDEDTEETS